MILLCFVLFLASCVCEVSVFVEFSCSLFFAEAYGMEWCVQGFVEWPLFCLELVIVLFCLVRLDNELYLLSCERCGGMFCLRLLMSCSVPILYCSSPVLASFVQRLCFVRVQGVCVMILFYSGLVMAVLCSVKGLSWLFSVLLLACSVQGSLWLLLPYLLVLFARHLFSVPLPVLLTLSLRFAPPFLAN